MGTMQRELFRTGMMLLSGPDAIYAAAGEGSRYLESAITMRWHSAQCDVWRSVRVYCDGNGDESVGFLLPLVRVANWDRKMALEKRETAFGSVDTKLATLPSDSPEVIDRVKRLQAELDRSTFTSRGFAATRDFGEFPNVADGYLSVDLISGHQTASRGVWVSEAPRLAEAAKGLEEALIQHSTPTDRSGWLEAYDWSPCDLAGRKVWMWDGLHSNTGDSDQEAQQAGRGDGDKPSN